MKIEFRPSSPSDADELAALCRRVLGVPAGSPMFEAPLLHWKYWQPWSTWGGSRSYVLTRGERLIAHCAVMPLVLEHAGRALTLLYPFDWAAEPRVVGSGAALLERMTTLADGVVIVGGSELTQRMAEPLGFRPSRAVTRLACPRGASRAVPSDVEVRRVGVLTNTLTRAPGGTDSGLPVQHPVQVLNEWLGCPAARVRYYEVRRSGAPLGAFLLASTPGQTRLLELWTVAPEATAGILDAARTVAERDRGSAELVAMANTPLDEQALMQAGFHACGSVPMFTAFRAGALPESSLIRYQLLHGDMGFLHHGEPERWSESPR